jgi:phosphatidylethanolamine/phosphatidyl-N-methylethanolamine N-methyltransferase
MLFLSQWLAKPREIGAISPSSRFLARAMVSQLRGIQGTTLELGAGTGSITQELIKSHGAVEQLLVIESSAQMAERLAERFSQIRVVQADAAHLAGLLESHLPEPPEAIVSSLPLLSLPKLKRLRILVQIASILKPGGRLIQFTYSPFSPINKRLCERLGLKGHRVKFVLLNLPPATVWVYEKR